MAGDGQEIQEFMPHRPLQTQLWTVLRVPAAAEPNYVVVRPFLA